MLKHQGLLYLELEYYDIVLNWIGFFNNFKLDWSSHLFITENVMRMVCPHGVVIGWKCCIKNLAMLGVCHHGIVVDISFSMAMTLA